MPRLAARLLRTPESGYTRSRANSARMPTEHSPPPTPSAGVVCQTLDDGAVLFSLGSEVYHGLNRTAARVWTLLPPATDTVPELCDPLAQAYPEVLREELEADVLALLEQLTHARLAACPVESNRQ